MSPSLPWASGGTLPHVLTQLLKNSGNTCLRFSPPLHSGHQSWKDTLVVQKCITQPFLCGGQGELLPAGGPCTARCSFPGAVKGRSIADCWALHPPRALGPGGLPLPSCRPAVCSPMEHAPLAALSVLLCPLPPILCSCDQSAIHAYICPSPPIHPPSVHLSIHPLIHPSFHPPICPSILPSDSIHPSPFCSYVHLPMCLSVPH